MVGCDWRYEIQSDTNRPYRLPYLGLVVAVYAGVIQTIQPYKSCRNLEGHAQ